MEDRKKLTQKAQKYAEKLFVVNKNFLHFLHFCVPFKIIGFV